MAVVFKNNAKTTLSAGITSSATSITVTDGSVFPSLSGGDVFFLTLDDLTNNEIVKCTAISGNTLTVVRAQEGTTARAFSANNQAELRITAGILGLFSQTDAVITDEIEAYLDANGLTFPDNVKGQFGSSNDLQIYHDGSDSIIHDNGTGNLKIRATNLRILNAAGTQNFISHNDGGDVKLYYAGNQKLATTSTGIDVTGNITTSSSTPTHTLQDSDGTNQLSTLAQDGGSFILTARNNTSNGNIIFKGNNGSSVSEYARFNSSGNFSTQGNITVGGNLTVNGTTTTLNTATLDVEDKNITLNYSTGDSSASANGAGITIQDAVNSTTDATILWEAIDNRFDFSNHIGLPDDKRIKLGDNQDLQIFHNSTNNHSVITESGSGDLRLSADDLYIKNAAATENKAVFLSDGAVKLYYNDAEKIKTTSTGIDVTGTAVVDGLTSSGIATVDELSVTNDATFNGSIDVGGGTIDCGAITSIGNSRFNGDFQVGDTLNQNAFGALQVNQTSNVDEEGIAVLAAAGGRSIRIWVDETNSYINSGNGGSGNLIFNEAITVSSGGNLTGVGTINSGAITSSGNINTTAGEFKINGVTVINASRQLRNIEAIRIQSTEIMDNTRLLKNITGIELTGDNRQIKFLGDGGPYGLEFGDTEANPNFRLYYRTSPNTLTFENNASSAKHTFDLSGNYTSTGDITSGDDVIVGDLLIMAGGNTKAIAFTGTGSDTNVRHFAYEESGHHYVTNRHTDGDLILKSNNGTGGGELARMTLQAGSGTQEIDITNANLDLNSNNITGVGTISSGAITSSGLVTADELSVTNDSTFNGSIDATGQTITSGAITAVNSGNVLTVGDGTRAFRVFTDSDEVSLLADGSVAMKFYTSGAEKMRIDTSGRVGIGTTSPAYKLDVVGKIKSSDRVLSNVYQSTSTYGMAWKNSGGTDNMFLSNAGSLGIGTTSPARPLDVNGSARLSDGSSLEWGGTSANIAGSSSSDTLFFRTASTERARIDSSGRVGIGTASPAAKLHVAGDIRLSDNFIDFKSGGNAVNPQFKGKREDTTSLSSRAFTDEGGFSYTTFADEASDAPTGATNNANGLITMNTHGGAYVHQLAMTSSGNMYHRYNNGGSLSSWSKIHKGGALTDVTSLTMSGDLAVNTNNLFVDVSAAKVGIGTSSPSRKLTVQGGSGDNLPVRIIGGASTTQSALEFQDPSTTADYKVTLGSKGDDLFFQAGGSERARIDSSGNLIIGNTSAGAKLDIRQDSGYAIRAENGSGHYFRVAATGQVEITNNAVDGTASLLLNCTENSQNASPILEFNRDSASPADADYLGQIKFTGENDNDQSVLYSKITGKISDASDTTEDGIIEFMTKKAGANNISMRLGPQSLQLINGTGLTVAGDATITGDLTVNGTTTTLNTATLDVEDKNITLNYSSSDSSGSANGAGITIQDAVSAGNDATILWDASSDRFDFSHPIEVGTLDVDVITNASGVVHLNDTLYLQDNSKAVFGDSSDLQIYHDGSHSRIDDTGTGKLILRGSTDVEIHKYTGEYMITANADGAVKLYHDDSVRLTTQAAGIKVNSAQVGGINAPTLNIGQLNNAYQSGMESSVHLTMKTYNPSGNFYFYRQNTIQASIIDGNFGIGQTTVIDSSRNLLNLESISMPDSKKIKLGAGDDLQLFHNGSSSVIRNDTGHLDIKNGSNDADIRFMCDDGSGGEVTYMTIDGSHSRISVAKEFIALDNVPIRVGSGGDAEFKHDGSNTYLINKVGDFYIQNTADDKDIVFQSDNGAGGVQTYFSLDGSAEQVVFEKSARFTDNDKAIFGTGSDLEIYHDGSHSYIEDAGTGNLYIRGDNTIDIRRQVNGEQYITAVANGAVTLFYDGSSKLATTSSGINVTGAIQLNGTNFATESSNGAYHELRDPTARTAIFLGGSDEGNYYDNSNHYFRNRSSNNYAYLNANGFYLSQGSYRVGTTTVIDSSRNLTNIGTISSGAITTSGDITAGAAAIGNTGEGHPIGHQYKKEYWYDESVGDSDGADTKWTLVQANGNVCTSTTTGKVYRVRLVTLGTGTNTGSVWLADNVDGNGWRVKAVSINTSPTESSNYPKLEIDNSVPKVSLEHTSAYSVRIFVEEYDTGNNGGMYTIFGTDALLTYRDNGTRLGINRETPGQTLDVNGTIGINGTEIITTSRNLHNIGSISSGAITSGAITSSGSITSGGTLTGASSELLRRTVSGWTVPTQTVLGSYYGSNLGDYIYLKVPGNSTNAHGVALVTDNAFYYGRDNRETGQITNDATSPLNENTGFKVTYDGDATLASANIGGGTSHFSEKLLVQGLARFAHGSDGLEIAYGTGYGNHGTLRHDDQNFIITMDRTSGTGNINLTPYENVNITTGALEIGGTSVISASRNLVNIGTISSGAITSTALSIETGAPILTLKDTTDDDDHQILFKDNGGTVRYQITSAGDQFNFATDGSREIVFKPSDTEKFRIGTAYNESKQDIRITTGGLRIGSTTVIDSSRNFTANNINLTSELNFTGNGNKYIDVETLALSNALTIRHHNPSGNLFETAMIMYANGGTIINYDGSGRLSTTSAGASITGSLNITSAITHTTHGTILDSSANLTNINNVYASGYRIGSTQIVDSSRNLNNLESINMPDSKIIKLGTGLDLQIYHNGTDSFINNDTGTLFIKQFANDGDIKILSDDGSGNTTEYIRCDGGLGQVKLFHYGSEKFITTSAGVKVTGELNLTGELEINGTDVIDSSRNLVNINSLSVAGYIYHTGDTDTNIQFGTDTIQLNTGGSLRFQANNSSATVLGIPLIVSAPNSAEMQFKQTTGSTTASKGSVQWFDSGGNSCGTINLKANGSENNSGVMEFYVTAESDELGDDPFGINKMMTITENGVQVHGSLSKSSGSFRIDHPLKPETHDLVHSFVEGPQADNLYRGVIKLENGRATVDLDEWFDMTAGTFLALNRDIQAFVNNSETWDAVRAKVMGSQLVIECQNPESNAEVSWLVIGERQDKEIHESALTNDNGKIIVEPEKVG